jgi:hypothetical protein
MKRQATRRDQSVAIERTLMVLRSSTPQLSASSDRRMPAAFQQSSAAPAHGISVSVQLAGQLKRDIMSAVIRCNSN